MTQNNQSDEFKEYVGRKYYKLTKEHTQLKRDLLEYMGYDDTFLTTKVGYRKQTKEQLIETVFQQRAMMRKLLGELDEDKRAKLVNELDEFYMERDNCKK
ncbi:hypothetical protein ACU3L3_07000 [Priestia endophytica]